MILNALVSAMNGKEKVGVFFLLHLQYSYLLTLHCQYTFKLSLVRKLLPTSHYTDSRED